MPRGATQGGKASECLAWQGRRATRKILESLDDRSLHDIGLDRSEIESVIQELDMALSRQRSAAILAPGPHG